MPNSSRSKLAVATRWYGEKSTDSLHITTNSGDHEAETSKRVGGLHRLSSRALSQPPRMYSVDMLQ